MQKLNQKVKKLDLGSRSQRDQEFKSEDPKFEDQNLS